jgi:hypothetical protein
VFRERGAAAARPLFSAVIGDPVGSDISLLASGPKAT